MKHILDKKGQVSIVEQTLSDRSKAYSVHIDGEFYGQTESVTIDCVDEFRAVELFTFLTDSAKVSGIY